MSDYMQTSEPWVPLPDDEPYPDFDNLLDREDDDA